MSALARAHLRIARPSDDLEAVGHAAVPSFNPYWDVRGNTFEDPDGYRVVLENAAWPA